MVSPTLTRDIWESCQVPDKAFVFREFRGLWGWVLDHRQPLLTNTPHQDPRSSGTPAGHIPIERFLAVPAMIGDRLVGEVALANAERDYSERDLSVIERLTGLYAIAVQRHWSETALRQRTADLQTRNEELDAFSHTVAHDLQNPVTVLLGNAEALEQGLVPVSDQRLREYHEDMARNARRIANIIDELLLLAGVRKTEVETASLDMASIVAEAEQRLADLIRRHQARIRLPESWPRARGYGAWVVEVWVNYLSNVLKYGGRPPVAELGARPERNVGAPPCIRFWIKDNGPGLSAEERARLFVPFTRLAQVRAEGHGLGLSIARRIVEKLGGEVGVESEGPGQGSTFSFTLPAEPATEVAQP